MKDPVKPIVRKPKIQADKPSEVKPEIRPILTGKISLFPKLKS
jgi:hypothetical protein